MVFVYMVCEVSGFVYRVRIYAISTHYPYGAYIYTIYTHYLYNIKPISTRYQLTLGRAILSVGLSTHNGHIHSPGVLTNKYES